MPSSVYQSKRVFCQYSYHWPASSGGTKNSISICSNSRVRKMKLAGVISLRNDLPTWAIPNGGGVGADRLLFFLFWEKTLPGPRRRGTLLPPPLRGAPFVFYT